MARGDCTAPIEGHTGNSVEAIARCPVHGRGLSSARGWTPRTPGLPPTVSSTPPPATPRTNYSGQYKLVSDLSEQVIDLMLTAPKDRVEAATNKLLDALEPAGGRVSRGGHFLCELFEEVAVGLQAILDTPSVIIDQLVGTKVAGSPILAAAARVLLKRVVALAATGGLLAGLVALHIKACLLALAFCPDNDGHKSLEKNCALPLAQVGVGLA